MSSAISCLKAPPVPQVSLSFSSHARSSSSALGAVSEAHQWLVTPASMEATSGRLMSRQIARFLEQLKSDLLHSCGGDHNDPHGYTIGYLIGALQEEEDVQQLRCVQQRHWPPPHDRPLESIASLTAQVILEDRAARRSERQPILEDENFEFGGRGGKLYETDEDARNRMRLKKCFFLHGFARKGVNS